MKRREILLGLLATAATAGCTPLQTVVAGPPPQVFMLSPGSTFSPDLPRVSWQLIIEEPMAAGGLDTVRVALEPRPLQIEYFGQARWAERAPRMVQTLLIESFENSGRIVGVGRPTVGLRGDYVLRSELREFQAAYQGPGDRAPVVRVRQNVRLVDQLGQEIIASRNFEATAVPTSDSLQAIVQGFDQALNQTLRDVVEWVFETVPPEPPRA